MAISNDFNKTRYTHRDYNSIKQDLIGAIPSLTQEWTSREESDPGIVLIKLMSMFGDTLSYNIDKIALEVYLDSVTQRKNCAKILRLLGYKMHWYRAARVTAHVRLINEFDTSGNLNTLVITPYSSIFHTNTVNYVAVQQNGSTGPIVISGTTTVVPINLIQGRSVTVTFKSSELINNRYYLGSLNVDESEFILNAAASSGSGYVRCEFTDNLYLVASNSVVYYEFNVDEYDRPYIQLSSNWRDVLQSTDDSQFVLTYILTDGALGNVSSNAFTYISDIGGSSATIYNTAITNLSNAVNYGEDGQYLDSYNSPGRNPQTTEDARLESANYVFTHDTLVTPSDFEKAAKRTSGITISKLVDNQVIVNEGLDAEEIANRALDHFETTEYESDNPIEDLSGTALQSYQIILYLGYQYLNAEYNYYYASIPSDNEWSLNPSYVVTDSEGNIYYVNAYDEDGNIIINPAGIPGGTITGNPKELGYYEEDPESPGEYIKTEDTEPDPLKTYYQPEKVPYTLSYGEGESTIDPYSIVTSKTLEVGFYPYKPIEAILQTVRDNLRSLQVLNTKLDFGTLKVFPFKVSGTLYLVEPLSPQETYQILSSVKAALINAYYPSNYSMGEKPKFLDIVNIIQNSDVKIKYFDSVGNPIEWSPAINASDPSRDNYIDKIFDSTSVILYDGLSGNFNFAKDFLRFRIKNIGIQASEDPQALTDAAYLVNYSNYIYQKSGSSERSATYKIPVNHIDTLELDDVGALKALCQDMTFKGMTEVYLDEGGEIIAESRLIDNTGLQWMGEE